MDLSCPKCQGVMRHYERSGVTVDQCTECRGVFLDRGELERLVDAENQWHSAQAPAAGPVPTQVYVERDGRDAYRGGDRDEYRGGDRDDHREGDRGDYRYGKKKKRRSFLDELFD